LYLENHGFRRSPRIVSKIFNNNYRHQPIINRIQKAGLKVLKENPTVKMTKLHMYIKWSEEHEFGLLSIGKRFEVSPGKASVLRKIIDKII